MNRFLRELDAETVNDWGDVAALLIVVLCAIVGFIVAGVVPY